MTTTANTGPKGAPSGAPTINSLAEMETHIASLEQRTAAVQSTALGKITAAEVLLNGGMDKFFKAVKEIIIDAKTLENIDTAARTDIDYCAAIDAGQNTNLKSRIDSSLLAPAQKVKDELNKILGKSAGKPLVLAIPGSGFAAVVIESAGIDDSKAPVYFLEVRDTTRSFVEIDLADPNTYKRFPDQTQSAVAVTRGNLWKTMDYGVYQAKVMALNNLLPANLDGQNSSGEDIKGEQISGYDVNDRLYFTHLIFVDTSGFKRQYTLQYSEDGGKFTIRKISGFNNTDLSKGDPIEKDLNKHLVGKALDSDTAESIVSITRSLESDTEELPQAARDLLVQKVGAPEKPKGWRETLGAWWSNSWLGKWLAKGNNARNTKRGAAGLLGLGLAGAAIAALLRIGGGEPNHNNYDYRDSGTDIGADGNSISSNQITNVAYGTRIDAGKDAPNNDGAAQTNNIAQAATIGRDASSDLASLVDANARSADAGKPDATNTDTGTTTQPNNNNAVQTGQRVTTTAPVAAAVVAPPTPSTTQPTITLTNGVNSGDVNGGTAAHPERHNDSTERFLVHGANRILDIVAPQLAPAQRTRVAGGIGHVLQQHVDTYLNSHPVAARRYGQIHHGDHGSMTVEQVTRGHGHRTHQVLHIQLHRKNRQGIERVVLDLNVPVAEINSILNRTSRSVTHAAQGTPAPLGSQGQRALPGPRTAPARVRQLAGSGDHVTPSAHPGLSTPQNRAERRAQVREERRTAAARNAQRALRPRTVVDRRTTTTRAATPTPAPTAAPTPAPSVQPQPEQQVASNRTVERVVDRFVNLSTYQKQALGDFILAFNERIPFLHRVGSRTDFGSVGATLEYDSQNRPTLRLQVIGLPGTTNETSLIAEIPFVVVRRANGSIDLETDETRPSIFPRTSEDLVHDNMVTARRYVETLGSALTGDVTLTARENFLPNRDPIGPVDSIEEINRRVGSTVIAFSIERSNSGRGFDYHLQSHSAGIYDAPQISGHTPMDRAVTRILNQVYHVRLTPALSFTNHRTGEVEVINETDRITVLHPYESHPITRDAIVSALQAAVQATLQVRAFQNSSNAPARPRQPTPIRRDVPTPGADPLEGLPTTGNVVNNRHFQPANNIAIAEDQATYRALIEDLDRFYNDIDHTNQAA